MLVDAALGYIESSPQWAIFPVHPTTKRPLIKTGRDHAEHASTDPETIARWLTKEFPGCSIGMPTGAASGTVVIDADAKHDGEALLAELEAAIGALSRARAVRTQSGGVHLYFAHPRGGIRVKSGAGVASPLGALLGGRAGVDVRADGGIVVLPPSAGYRWLSDEDDLPALPRLWLAAIQGAGEPPPPPKPSRSSPSKTGTARATGAIGEGARNAELFRVGVALHHEGASEAEVLLELERANAARCSPPLPAREVQRIATSAARARSA